MKKIAADKNYKMLKKAFLGKTRFAHPTVRQWANLIRRAGRLANRSERKLKRMGIDLMNPENSLKANGGSFNSLEEMEQAAVSIGAYQGLIAAFQEAFNPNGIFSEALTHISHEESVSFINEIKRKFPEMEFDFSINGRRYSTH
tara:strand:+ start:44 stop:475 length:432 start_codon:yes stop_codon:yes gene_type:complete